MSKHSEARKRRESEGGKKVVIVGTAISSRVGIPYDDPSFEIWGLSEQIDLPRVTRWFELHNLERKRHKNPPYVQDLAAFTGEVWLARPHELIPNAKIYPRERILNRFRDYFTNTVSWLLALAIDEGATEIMVAGIDMAQNTEYAHQRPSCEYFIGLAEGMGIKVTVPAESDLLKARIQYGFDDAGDRMAVKMAARVKELHQRRVALQHQVDKSKEKALMAAGAIHEIQRLSQCQEWNGHMDILAARLTELNNEAQSALAAEREHDRGLHVVMGAEEDVKWVMQGF